MERKLLLYILLCAMPAAVILLSENFEVSSTPTVTAAVGQDVVLPCQISTRRQPENMEVQWKKIIQAAIETVYEYGAQTGQDVPGQKYQGRTVLLKNGFASGNVSLKLKNIQPADVGIYSCIVKSNEWSADDTTELKLAGDVCPHGSPWLAAFWVLLVLDILVIGAYAFWRYKGNCWKKQGNDDPEKVKFLNKKEKFEEEKRDFKKDKENLQKEKQEFVKEKEKFHQDKQKLKEESGNRQDAQGKPPPRTEEERDETSDESQADHGKPPAKPEEERDETSDESQADHGNRQDAQASIPNRGGT